MTTQFPPEPQDDNRVPAEGLSAHIYRTTAGGIYVVVTNYDWAESTAASSFRAGRKWLADGFDPRFGTVSLWEDDDPRATFSKTCELD